MNEDFRNIDSLKEKFENWEPEFSEQDLREDWSRVSHAIKPASPVNLIKPYRSFVYISAVIVATSVISYFVIKNVIEKKNEITAVKTIGKTPEQTIPKKSTIYSETISKLNHLIRKKDNQQVSVKEPEIEKSTFTNHVESPLSISTKQPDNSVINLFKEALNNPVKNEGIISQNQGMFPLAVQPKFPEIAFGSSSTIYSSAIKIYDTIICINDSLRITSNLPGQLSIILPDNMEIKSSNNRLCLNFNETGECFVKLKYTDFGKVSVKNQRIIIIGKPNADFKVDLSEVPDVKFSNTTFNGNTYSWSFGDNSTSTLENPLHKYIDTGFYSVTLVAFTRGGCNDTMTKTVQVSVSPELIAPNVFSPNGDGINDRYKVAIKGEIYFYLSIFDSDGLVLFSTSDKNEPWDGKYKGRDCNPGVYYYVIRYQFVGQDKILKQSGTINLFR